MAGPRTPILHGALESDHQPEICEQAFKAAVARSDLLINLVKAGSGGDQVGFRRTLEALVAEERGVCALLDARHPYIFTVVGEASLRRSLGFLPSHLTTAATEVRG